MLYLQSLSRLVLDSLQTLFVTGVLASTRQTSVIRYLCIPILSAILYLQLTHAPVIDNVIIFVTECSLPFSYLLQTNILLITSIDFKSGNDGVLPSLYERIKRSFLYQVNARGVGTVYQVKNIPPMPAYISKKGYLSRKYRFVIRQLVLFAWQYLLVDVGYSLWNQLPDGERFDLFAPGTEWNLLNAGAQQWRIRLVVTFLFWVTVRNSIDLPYRLGSAIMTAVGATSPHEWPPWFGTIRDAYTLRNFWGMWWHQQLRWPLSSHSSFVSRRILQLPRHSLLERYLNNSIVHALSAIIHINAWRLAQVHDGYLSCFMFFMSFVGGYMIEDYIQHIWTNIKIRRSGIDARASTKLLLFEFLTGALWVGAFLTITTPLWIYPLLRRQHAFTLPYSFVNTFGMNNVLTVICIGAMILKSKFDANV